MYKSRLECLDVSGCELTSASLEHISIVPIKELYVESCSLNDSCVDVISRMKGINKLNMDNNIDITSNSLFFLSRLTNMSYLNISNCNCITSSSLEHITKLPITELKLEACDIDDKCLHVISCIKHLKRISVGYNTEVSAVGLSYLSSVELTHLDIERIQIGQQEGILDAVSRIKSLKSLNISKNHITSAGLALLSATQVALYELDMEDCDCTDSCMAALYNMTSLRKLNISDNYGITAQGIGILAYLNLQELTAFIPNDNSDGMFLKAIGKIKTLVKLDIANGRFITSDGLHYFAGLNNLKYLRICRSKSLRPAESALLSHIDHLDVSYYPYHEDSNDEDSDDEDDLSTSEDDFDD